MAAIRMNDDAMIIDMNPGFSVTVRVPFDVPPGTTATEVRLHDSAFSRGRQSGCDSTRARPRRDRPRVTTKLSVLQ